MTLTHINFARYIGLHLDVGVLRLEIEVGQTVEQAHLRVEQDSTRQALVVVLLL